jgi:acyl transferase domain-containing protein
MKRLVWMFSGQGSQYYGMGADLYEQDPLFRQELQRCDDYLRPHLNASLIDIIYSTRATDRFADFSRTLYTHPALFSIQYSLARTLLRQTLRPEALVGYSLGEIVAAAVGDVLPLETALALVVDQARLLESSVVPGAMIAIIESPAIAADNPDLFAGTWLAAHNYGTHFVQAGDRGAVGRIREFMERKGVICQVLPVRTAFHTPHLDSMEGLFRERCMNLQLRDPSIAIISARRTAGCGNISKEYFWQAVREPVRFKDTLESLEQTGCCYYVDLGPSGTMASFVKYGLSLDSRSSFQAIITPFNQASRNICKVFNGVA